MFLLEIMLVFLDPINIIREYFFVTQMDNTCFYIWRQIDTEMQATVKNNNQDTIENVENKKKRS